MHAFRIIRGSTVMGARASIISKSEVSITVLCLLCSPRYTTLQTMNCSKTTSVVTVATMTAMKNTMMPRAPVIV